MGCRHAHHQHTSLSVALFETSEVTISRSSTLKSRRAWAARLGMNLSLYVILLLGDHTGLLLLLLACMLLCSLKGS